MNVSKIKIYNINFLNLAFTQEVHIIGGSSITRGRWGESELIQIENKVKYPHYI